MTDPVMPSSLRPAVAAVQRVIERRGRRGVLIGGVAIGLVARPRVTIDVDAMLLATDDDPRALLDIAESEGLTPRITDAEAFAQQRRVLLLHHPESGVDVDLSLGVLPFEVEMVERATNGDLDGIAVQLPTPEDLVIMKAVAHRRRDLSDIEEVIAVHPNLDGRRVQYWVQQFAEALEMPELWSDIAPWFR